MIYPKYFTWDGTPREVFEFQAWGDRGLDCKPVVRSQITIGVELEAYLYGLNPQDTEEKEFETYEAVASALQPLAEKLGTRASLNNELKGTCQTSSEVNEPDYATFQIMEDASIDPGTSGDDLPGDSVLGIEIATPVLRSGSWSWVVPEMTQILKSSFKLGFNSTTGLHVHVGIGRPYRLQDLVRLSKAIIIFEKQMDTYHPRCRRGCVGLVPYQELNIWILSCRDSSAPLVGLSDIEMMKKIDAAVSNEKEEVAIYQLLRTINSSPGGEILKQTNKHFSHPFRGYRYNLTCVRDIGTIEFRQAIGTDDGDQAVDWINRAIQFVVSAVATPDEAFHEWAERGIGDPNIYRRFGVPPPDDLRAGASLERVQYYSKEISSSCSMQ